MTGNFRFCAAQSAHCRWWWINERFNRIQNPPALPASIAYLLTYFPRPPLRFIPMLQKPRCVQGVNGESGQLKGVCGGRTHQIYRVIMIINFFITFTFFACKEIKFLSLRLSVLDMMVWWRRGRRRQCLPCVTVFNGASVALALH